MSISDKELGPGVDAGDMLALLVGEGVSLSLGLFLAENSLESLPLPLDAVLLWLSNCSSKISAQDTFFPMSFSEALPLVSMLPLLPAT